VKKNPLRRLQIRVFSLLARVAPGAESLRPWLHRMRGVKISGSIFIGEDVLLETEYPERVEIHDNVSISMRAIIIAHTRGMGQVILEKNCFIGPNALICCSAGKVLRVGEGAVVSAGSVITRSVPPRTMVAPPPTRPVATLAVPFTSDVSMDQFLSGMKLLKGPTPRA
jgi:carbonic anhydrase/acetyltransferase-like protein (isoleucine patch superfamily)